MKLQHGRLSIDVPPGWSDQSTLLLVAPPDETSAPTASSVHHATEAVAVHFIIAGDDDARALLGQDIERLQKLDAELVLVEQGPFTCGLGEGWSTVQRYRLGGSVIKQISVCVLVGPVAVMASASTTDGGFDKKAPALWNVLRSLALENK